MIKFFFPAILGLLGASFLIYLGIWQTQRLQWKNDLIEKISSEISKPGKELVLDKINLASNYKAVKAFGEFLEEELHVLHSLKPYGPGFKIIKPFRTLDKKDILVEIGFIPEKNKDMQRNVGPGMISGNIVFPNETDYFTPDPNLDKNIWFSRDLESMASHLGTYPILVVLSSGIQNENIIITPLKPNLRNNHLEYAVTWFLMAGAWVFMTFYWFSKILKKPGGGRGSNVV